jgi:hypothetical protein
MSQQRTKLIDTTLERIETNLVRRRASQKAAQLYRVTTGEGCYFAARADMDREDFDCIEELEPGTRVRVCVFERRGRRHIAWIRSLGRSIPPYDVLGQRQRNFKSLPISLGILAICLGAIGIRVALIAMLAIFVGIVSFLGCLVAIGGFIDSLNPIRVEAQERWQSEPYRFVVEGEDR